MLLWAEIIAWFPRQWGQWNPLGFFGKESLSQELMHWSLSPFSMSASYSARHFSNQSRYSCEQKKNPCSHKTFFLVCFYSKFPQTPRAGMLGTFFPAVKLSRPCTYSSHVNKNLTLYSAHSISLDHVRRSWPGSALEPFRQEVRKLSLGTRMRRELPALRGECALFSRVTPYPSRKDGEQRVGSEQPPETGCLASDKKLCHIRAVFLWTAYSVLPPRPSSSIKRGSQEYCTELPWDVSSNFMWAVKAMPIT